MPERKRFFLIEVFPYSDGSSPEQELHAVCETFQKIIVALEGPPKAGTGSSPKGVHVPMCSVTHGLDNSHVISWQQIKSLEALICVCVCTT